MDLNDKVVFITGGCGGLGKAFANIFLREGAKVCIADLFEEPGQNAAKELGEAFPSSNIIFTRCNVTSDESFEEAIDNCETRLGPVNILINNAGIVDEINWKRAIDVNLVGTIRGCEIALKKMGKHNGGSGGNVINVGSASGLTPNVASVYTATKGGVIMYTRSVGMPIHYSYTGICFQTICPTLVDTPFLGDLKRNVQHDNVAKFMTVLDKMPRIKTEDVAEATLKLLHDGKSGSVMVLAYGKEPQYVEVPDLATAK